MIIDVQRVTEARRAPGNLAQLPFSAVLSDHMLVAEYRDGGWRTVGIRPYGPLPLPPTISALQYGVSVFEGLKAHRLPNGDVGLFRPADNAARLNRSARRLAMPEVPEQLFLDGLRALVQLDREWVPPHGEGALYIRPCYFSTDESIRVKPAERYLLVIFTFPFAAYYGAPVAALATDGYVRAFPGGTGEIKAAGNYAAALLLEREAQAAGFHAVLWLDGRDRTFVEECGTMNIFFVVGDEVITPSLEGTILPGVTRDSVIRLLRDHGVTVSERRVSIADIAAAAEAGSLRECFGTGTAVTLSPIARIRYRDRDITIPPLAEGSIGAAVRERLVGIATGRVPDPYGWVQVV